MLKPNTIIGSGAALAVVVVTWPSEAILPCDPTSHVARMMCTVEPPELAHGPEDHSDQKTASKLERQLTQASTGPRHYVMPADGGKYTLSGGETQMNLTRQ
jgi:hypothetical protein